MEIQTPAPTLMKFCSHISTCPRKVLMQVGPHPPPTPGPGGPETLKPERQRCSAGCILTRAAPGTSASQL